MKAMFLTAVTMWLVACSGHTTSGEDGGENEVELKRQAASAASEPEPGSGPAGDVCSANGWYGDGACDVFCEDHDVDCSVKDVVCLAYIEEPNGSCDREPGDPCVGQDPDCSGLPDPIICTAIAMERNGVCQTDPKNPCLRYQDPDCANSGETTPSEPDPGNGGSIPGDPGSGAGGEPVGCLLLLELPNGVCSRDSQDPCKLQDPDCMVE
jgi:hypothetical protein